MKDFLTTWWKVPIPEGWETQKTRDFLRLTSGSTPPSQARIYFCHKPYVPADDTDIERYAKSHQKPTSQRKTVTLGILSGSCLSDTDETQDRVKWFLVYGYHLVLVFFEGKTSDVVTIEGIISHLELTEEGKKCANIERVQH
jgi:hypothetical protein